MSKQLKAADQLLGFFTEQIEGPYASLYFDSSVAPDPLQLDVGAGAYRAVRFEWSGTEALDLRNLEVGTADGGLTKVPLTQRSVTANTPEFALDGQTFCKSAPPPPKPEVDLPFQARVALPRQPLDRVSLERFAHFRPLATNLRITLETDTGEDVQVYDKDTGEADLQETVAAYSEELGAPKVVKFTVPALLDIMNIRLDATRRSFFRIRRRLGEAFFGGFGINLNKKLLHTRHLEFGQHGVSHSFRYWSDAEKDALIDSYSVLVKAYKKAGFDSICCFGFLLGMVREGDLIPHDDDIDLMVFNADPKVSNLHIMALISGIAAQAGFEVIKISFDQKFARLKTPDNQDLDVFVCTVEQDKCHVYPSRSAYSDKATIFPTKDRKVLNRKLPFPQDPETLLEDIYGDDWRVPKPYFFHNW